MAWLWAVRARHAMMPPNARATASRPLITNNRAPTVQPFNRTPARNVPTDFRSPAAITPERIRTNPGETSGTHSHRRGYATQQRQAAACAPSSGAASLADRLRFDLMKGQRQALAGIRTRSGGYRGLQSSARLEPGGLRLGTEPRQLHLPGERGLQSGACIGPIQFRCGQGVFPLKALTREPFRQLFLTHHRGT